MLLSLRLEADEPTLCDFLAALLRILAALAVDTHRFQALKPPVGAAALAPDLSMLARRQTQGQLLGFHGPHAFFHVSAARAPELSFRLILHYLQSLKAEHLRSFSISQ